LQTVTSKDTFNTKEAAHVYDDWIEWDNDRALDECIQRFYLASPVRKASLASMLGAVLFQSCRYEEQMDLVRAEKILHILTIPEYSYILKTYLVVNCEQRLTRKGNNLLKLLDDCGINPHINVNPIAGG